VSTRIRVYNLVTARVTDTSVFQFNMLVYVHLCNYSHRFIMSNFGFGVIMRYTKSPS